MAINIKSISSVRGNTFCWTNEKKGCPNVVFLPGLTAGHTLFEKQIDAFGNDYNIIVWDCPGHGKSRPYTDFTYPNVAEELKSILVYISLALAIGSVKYLHKRD